MTAPRHTQCLQGNPHMDHLVQPYDQDKHASTAGIIVDTLRQSASDTQVGGTHYKDMAVQPWDAMQAWMTPEQFNGFLLGSALAYIARVNTVGKEGKGGRQDIAKAQHYLQKWLEVNPA